MNRTMKISDEHHSKLITLSGDISMKDYLGFLIDYAHILGLKYQNFSNSDLTNKQLEESLVKKITSRHNTVIAFIKEQDKHLATYFTELADRDKQLFNALFERLKKLEAK